MNFRSSGFFVRGGSFFPMVQAVGFFFAHELFGLISRNVDDESQAPMQISDYFSGAIDKATLL